MRHWSLAHSLNAAWDLPMDLLVLWAISQQVTSLTLGLRYALGQKAEINATTHTGLASHTIQSLKSLRRAALPRHWRNSVHLGAQGIESDASIFPSLDCLLGCYDSDPDPQAVHVNNFGLPGLIDLPSAGRLPMVIGLNAKFHESLARSGVCRFRFYRVWVLFSIFWDMAKMA